MGATDAARWLRRASEHFRLRDFLALGLPPVLAVKAVRYARTVRARSGPPDEPLEGRDPEFVELFTDVFRFLGERYFRWEVRGVERLPATGPALLVGNHNGGMLITDTFLTFVAVMDEFGPERALYGLAHDVALDDPTLRRYARKLGALRAGHAGARKALGAGHLVLVYPGSDLDSFRPWSARNRVELGNRKGFLKLALRAGVPVVPVVSAGTHEQLVVLTRGDELARALGVKRLLRTEVLPITLAVPWGVTVGWLPYVPLPAQTTLHFGEPLRWPELGPDAADDPAAIDRCYEDVREAMQRGLDEITADRVPFLGQRPRR